MSLDKQPKGLGDQIERFTEATGIKEISSLGIWRGLWLPRT